MEPSTTKTVTDLLGIQPVAKAVEKLTDAGIGSLSSLLSRICLPAAEEYGLYMKDKVSNWRKIQAEKFAKLSQEKMNKNNIPGGAHAPPRIVRDILEQASWVDDSVVQDMWAGLLSSSCSQSGEDDSNLIFIELLNRMTKLQARILELACRVCPKKVSRDLVLPSVRVSSNVEKLSQILGIAEVHKLDFEIDALREYGLLTPEAGIYTGPIPHVEFTPSSMALYMYVRCQGSRLSPAQFFKLEIENDTTELSIDGVYRKMY